jgi:replicative DNA helicase
MDKYLRRQLISAGHEIIELGYDTTQELDVVFDECEKKIFRLTQKRAQEGLVSISETLIHTFTELEKLHQKTSSPGLETDFYDLDAITGGLQRSDLIILAGRPSMGKTAFGLNIASNIARKHNLPVAIFSLEMSKEQLALRFLASEAEIDSNRLRTGHFSQNELEPLSMALGSLSSLPIFIDDASNISVMQMRSQVRRLQSEQKGQIGLVLIDYLQLMEGATDNRVQELSKMTRSLKGLAREINAPVIALSQLSRGVESRTNKRPMMSDLRESGCLSGDSLITLADSGKQIPIRELVSQSNFFVWAFNEETMKLEKALVSNAFSTGIKPVYLLKTRLGRSIKATANHKFSTIEGWKRLDELDIGEHIALPQSEKITNLAHSDIYWDSIISITESGTEEVFDLTVPSLHNFVANDIIVHNSIEQDADLIMMIYRDEYYNPDSPDRGIAELLITKHRNGPTGVIKLLFKPEFTQFLNLQKYENY